MRMAAARLGRAGEDAGAAAAVMSRSPWPVKLATAAPRGRARSDDGEARRALTARAFAGWLRRSMTYPFKFAGAAEPTLTYGPARTWGGLAVRLARASPGRHPGVVVAEHRLAF